MNTCDINVTKNDFICCLSNISTFITHSNYYSLFVLQKQINKFQMTSICHFNIIIFFNFLFLFIFLRNLSGKPLKEDFVLHLWLVVHHASQTHTHTSYTCSTMIKHTKLTNIKNILFTQFTASKQQANKF